MNIIWHIFLKISVYKIVIYFIINSLFNDNLKSLEIYNQSRLFFKKTNDSDWDDELEILLPKNIDFLFINHIENVIFIAANCKNIIGIIIHECMKEIIKEISNVIFIKYLLWDCYEIPSCTHFKYKKNYYSLTDCKHKKCQNLNNNSLWCINNHLQDSKKYKQAIKICISKKYKQDEVDSMFNYYKQNQFVNWIFN